MKVLVIGSGGREHVLVWKIAQSPRVDKIYAAPGNAGMAGLAECVDIGVNDLNGLAAFAAANGIGLTVVGPEAPLTEGIVDIFAAKGLRVFGPNKAAAQMEGDKTFAKNLMKKYGIPTAAYEVFTDHHKACAYVKEQGAPIVIKASGLAAGKGAIVCMTEQEAYDALELVMVAREFGDAGNEVVIEEFMDGEEASVLALTDGTAIKTLVSSQDHKRAYDGDKGPNTGGMGAYCPAPVLTDELAQLSMDTVLRPTVEGLKSEGIEYRGVLYAGLMIKDGKPRVVEFNCRFGDPEIQAVLMLLESDLIDLMEAVIDGTLGNAELKNSDGAAVCIVQASGGYPGSYEKGKPISGLEAAAAVDDAVVFHAGTAFKDGAVVTAGGRVLGITARGDDVKKAVDTAYRVCGMVGFDGVEFRKDIAYRALARLQ